MINAGLDEAQAGIKIARRNINNLRYADDTTPVAKSEEELKRLLMKVKEESEKLGLKLNIPVELFQILKDDAVKVQHSNASKFRKLSPGHRTGKGQFSFQSQRKAMPKNAQTTAQLHSSHTLAK